jgi:hypothetical protein
MVVHRRYTNSNDSGDARHPRRDGDRCNSRENREAIRRGMGSGEQVTQ